MPKFQILSGVLEGKVIDLIEDRITIGRALDNMIRLEDATCSHHHAMLLSEEGTYKLRDLNSTNGTRVNGMRIVETRLNNGDQVRLGSVEIRYESDVRKSSQPLPPAQTGVDLSQAGAGSAPPQAFGTSSPFGRKPKGGKSNYLVYGVLVLGALAAIILALLFMKVIAMK
jgi:pSer/pThr/pTyr-binding forkhead associated (FHA) protein